MEGEQEEVKRLMEINHPKNYGLDIPFGHYELKVEKRYLTIVDENEMELPA